MNKFWLKVVQNISESFLQIIILNTQKNSKFLSQ